MMRLSKSSVPEGRRIIQSWVTSANWHEWPRIGWSNRPLRDGGLVIHYNVQTLWTHSTLKIIALKENQKCKKEKISQYYEFSWKIILFGKKLQVIQKVDVAVSQKSCQSLWREMKTDIRRSGWSLSTISSYQGTGKSCRSGIHWRLCGSHFRSLRRIAS